MTEAEIRAELQAILKEAQDRAELLGAVLELLDAERTQGDVHTRGGGSTPLFLCTGWRILAHFGAQKRPSRTQKSVQKSPVLSLTWVQKSL